MSSMILDLMSFWIMIYDVIMYGFDENIKNLNRKNYNSSISHHKDM